jgi:adenine-specific DNA-methyltransferase
MNQDLHQWFTPRWVAEAIVERHYAHLDMGDCVLEPSCGPGSFLFAIPDHVDAIGVEIDPVLAERARRATGRRVIAGDFLTAEITDQVTHVIGNPPFAAPLIAKFLDRAHCLLPEGGTCGFLLPAYVLQTSTKVLAMHERWSIEQELMPRNIFPRLKLPLVFTMFRKERVRTLVGFFLYREAADVRALPAEVRTALAADGSGSVWRRAVRAAFGRLGRTRVTLTELYATVERPSQNRYWREKVRQVLQTYRDFRRAGEGLWELNVGAVMQRNIEC